MAPAKKVFSNISSDDNNIIKKEANQQIMDSYNSKSPVLPWEISEEEKMKILKTLASAGLILTFITGIWFIDDRYVDAKEIKDIKEQINLRIDTYEYRELTKQYYELKKLVRENPDRPLFYSLVPENNPRERILTQYIPQ